MERSRDHAYVRTTYRVHDRLAEFFSDVTLEQLPTAGHFTPLEAPDRFATAIRAVCET